MNYLTESYDKRKEFEEIEPQLRAIHEFCQKHHIPYIFAACPFVDAESRNHQFTASAHLIGPEATPPSLAIANQMIQGGIADGIKMATAVVMSGYIDGAGDADADPAEGLDAAQPTVKGAFGNA